MASSRKPPSGKRIAVALSGGVDSVVLLHTLRRVPGVRAVHVHHGLSPNADAWAAFCRRLCKRLGVPLAIKKVEVAKRGEGLEAAARRARYEAFSKTDSDCIALAHHLDDQAETVLMNLLRGAGRRGASGMRRESKFHGKTLLRPLLDTPREAIVAYAREHRLEWIEDESNADESLTRNFVRRRLGPLLEHKYPKWRENLARAARHFSRKEAGAQDLLRKFLQTRGLRAPSEAKLVEMLKQLTSKGARTLIEHDGARIRVYRGRVYQGKILEDRGSGSFTPIQWKGESRLAIPALGGELRFRRARGKGIAASAKPLRVRLRAGGERLQPDPRRPRRTLKNLFQEAGVPPWERDWLPLLMSGDDVVWVPGLGVDVKYRAAKNASGVLPEWRKMPG
ncbi:MAG TPA: tRNA lysidine(34) synthetase TilS [Burkholderiales bacterium]|nr:tRNA lysidine(34) synthetase TilS [Burkholderiales bacterium]